MASCLSFRKVWYTLVVAILVLYPGSTAATRSSTTAHWVVVAPGWNLLSLPAGVATCSTHALFPTAISPAYVFEPGAGYVVRDTLRPGEGFWLRFASADTLLVHGESLLEYSVEVDSGWNLVGAISVPINAPRNGWHWWLLASEFFRYVPDVGFQADTVLRPGTGYWVKAGGPGSISMVVPGGGPCAVTPTVEYEGKTYNTVQIGTQCWLRENLDVGAMIPGSQDQTNNSTIEKYCYNDDTIYCAAYGGLYQWDEAMQYDTAQGSQGICPPGWHIPTLAEFQTLSSNVGGDGNALKAVGQGTGGGAGTNSSGFSVLLAGGRGSDGYFYGLDNYVNLWSSSQSDATNARSLYLGYSSDVIYLNYRNVEVAGLSVRCLRDNLPPESPSSPTPPDGSVGQSPALRLGWTCGGDPDGESITFDVYVGITNPPVTPVALGEPNASVGLTGLAGSAMYYWRVVARDEQGDTTAGPVWTFTTGAIGGSPCPGTPTVTYAGKTYNTVQIGSQCWLRENLDVGALVPGSQGQINNSMIEKYCYGDDTVNCAVYGGLYQWGEAMQYDMAQGGRGICPTGWHIPTPAEFTTLSMTAGNDASALKAIGQGSGDGTGTNTSGFSALLAGLRYSNGSFYFLGTNGYFWSSTQVGATSALGLRLDGLNAVVSLYSNFTTYGFGVRCLKD